MSLKGKQRSIVMHYAAIYQIAYTLMQSTKLVRHILTKSLQIVLVCYLPIKTMMIANKHPMGTVSLIAVEYNDQYTVLQTTKD